MGGRRSGASRQLLLSFGSLDISSATPPQNKTVPRIIVRGNHTYGNVDHGRNSQMVLVLELEPASLCLIPYRPIHTLELRFKVTLARTFPTADSYRPVGGYEDASAPRDESLKTAYTRTKAAGMMLRWKR